VVVLKIKQRRNFNCDLRFYRFTLIAKSLAPATSTKAPNSSFTSHQHELGEEFLVLDGVFEDEHGRYPKGFWLRIQHMCVHKPFSFEGCTILVKTGYLLAD
jgi:hypothetical protein